MQYRQRLHVDMRSRVLRLIEWAAVQHALHRGRVRCFAHLTRVLWDADDGQHEPLCVQQLHFLGLLALLAQVPPSLFLVGERIAC